MQSTVSSIKEGICNFCHLSLRDKLTNIESYRDGESVSTDSALGLGGHRRAQEREGLKVESQPADICEAKLKLDCLSSIERLCSSTSVSRMLNPCCRYDKLHGTIFGY